MELVCQILGTQHFGIDDVVDDKGMVQRGWKGTVCFCAFEPVIPDSNPITGMKTARGNVQDDMASQMGGVPVVGDVWYYVPKDKHSITLLKLKQRSKA